MKRTIIPLLCTLACNPFENWPDNSVLVLDDELWDPNVIPAKDGVYARLPHAGLLVRIKTDGSHRVVDLKGAAPRRIIGSPDGEHVVVLADWFICDDPDPTIELVEDCPEDALSREYEWAIVKNGRRTSVTEVATYLDTVHFTPDGDLAVMYMSEHAQVPARGVVNPTQVSFLDLDSGKTHSVTIGTQPTGILFSKEGDNAVVLSESEVVVIELEDFQIQTRYPLTLDADQTIEPAGATLSPDGRYALVAVTDSKDLFQLDLETASIDMEALDDVPSAMASDSESATTVVTYQHRNQVDVITEHGFIQREQLVLEEAAPQIAMGEGFAVLYNHESSESRDIYRLDLNTMERIEYVAANPVMDLQLTESGEHAVAILQPQDTDVDAGIQDRHWGLAILDLQTDDISNLILEAEPVGVALVQGESSAHALVLMHGVDSLIQVDLHQPGQIESIELSAPPAGIDAMPNGRFLITHDRALGLISFLQPDSKKIKKASRFAANDLLTEHPLTRRKTDKD